MTMTLYIVVVVKRKHNDRVRRETIKSACYIYKMRTSKL